MRPLPRLVVAPLLCLCFIGLLPLAACQDPCVTLAERICSCEKTTTARNTCRTERITNQQSSVTISDADRELCAAKLDTCTCDAIDTNNLDACGFDFIDPSGGGP